MGAGIIIDGKGVTVTHGGASITDILTVKFSLVGEAAEIDLTGVDNVDVETSLLSSIRKIKDITVTVKNNPSKIAALSLENKAMIITLPTATPTVCTFWTQLKSDGGTEVKVKARSDLDLVYHVTNLNASLIETKPTII